MKLHRLFGRQRRLNFNNSEHVSLYLNVYSLLAKLDVSEKEHTFYAMGGKIWHGGG